MNSSSQIKLLHCFGIEAPSLREMAETAAALFNLYVSTSLGVQSVQKNLMRNFSHQI